ncbi:MAG: carboxypeptidase regulatory-like domain-containing protein, partial [Gemmataceae bacterium]
MRHKLWTLVFLMLAGPGWAAEPAGSITGLIRYTGEVPKAKQVMTDTGPIEMREIDIDPKTKGLRHVFITIDNAPAQQPVEDVRAALIDQKSMTFVPRVIAIRQGQKVRFENNDHFNHSIQAVSTVEKNQLNVIATPGMPVEVEFVPQKLPVQIGCSMHFWMRAWVYVVKHPWFAITDDTGRFRIDNVPPGKYTLLLR